VLKPFFSFLNSEPVKTAVNFIANAIEFTIGGAFNALKAIADGVGGFIGGVIQTIVDSINAARAALDYLKGETRDAISAPIPKVNIPGPKKPSAPPPGTIGHRAGGGLVLGGVPYWVGERGPELFMPGRLGNIIPNHRLRGPEWAAGIDRHDLLRSVLEGILGHHAPRGGRIHIPGAGPSLIPEGMGGGRVHIPGAGPSLIPEGWGGGRVTLTQVTVNVYAGIGTDGRHVGRSVVDVLNEELGLDRRATSWAK
jgi:hypothetical protein